MYLTMESSSLKWFAVETLCDCNFPISSIQPSSLCSWLFPGYVYVVTPGNRYGATRALARGWRSHQTSWFSSSQGFTTPCECTHRHPDWRSTDSAISFNCSGLFDPRQRSVISFQGFGAVGLDARWPKAWVCDDLGYRLNSQLSHFAHIALLTDILHVS